jgi:hypothetical protein
MEYTVKVRTKIFYKLPVIYLEWNGMKNGDGVNT